MAHPVRAKKHLGQHFLVDENIARNIVDAMFNENSTNALIEIGPGTGVLTKHLIDRNNFFALDVDRDSIAFLKKNYPQFSNKIIEADFLETDLEKIVGDRKFNIIGNFPYNISSQIMFKVLEHKTKVDLVVGMFQKEVAERLAEGPGSKVYGILSVLLQAFYEIEYLFTVEPHVFSPPPKVKSAVIKLRRNSVQRLNCDEDLFKKVVKTAFNQRRKQIRNSVRTLLQPGADTSNKIFDRRPEQLSVEEFVELTLLIERG
jgi:16S rRNA (adenine1518-N6/adenine1519-N6)-dimethyltransferase